jgi:tetratricopeptide (TPR) repeat protein
MARTVGCRPVNRLAPAAVLVTVCLAAAACSSSTPSGTPAQLIQKGLAAQQAGNLDQALTDYQAALTTQPKNVAALYDVGTVYQARNDTSQAASWFQKAIAADRNFAPALYDLGVIEATSNPTQAIILFQEAVDAQPSDASAWFNLGVLRYRQGQVPLGRSDIQKAISLNSALASQVPSDVKL